jgi:hypothetical protein
MTMEHIARSFRVSLCITHPEIDPAEITRTVQLTPERETRAGAPRTTPAGRPLTGRYDFSHWMHQFDVQGATELGKVLQDLVQRLDLKQASGDWERTGAAFCGGHGRFCL